MFEGLSEDTKTCMMLHNSLIFQETFGWDRCNHNSIQFLSNELLFKNNTCTVRGYGSLRLSSLCLVYDSFLNWIFQFAFECSWTWLCNYLLLKHIFFYVFTLVSNLWTDCLLVSLVPKPHKLLKIFKVCIETSSAGNPIYHSSSKRYILMSSS